MQGQKSGSSSLKLSSFQKYKVCVSCWSFGLLVTGELSYHFTHSVVQLSKFKYITYHSLILNPSLFETKVKYSFIFSWCFFFQKSILKKKGENAKINDSPKYFRTCKLTW